MAASATMQSVIGSSFTLAATKNKTSSQFRSSALDLPRLYRSNTHLTMRIRCMAKYGDKEESGPSTPTAPKGSQKFLDLFAFSGPAPERINGRLAMVGFVAAMAVELYNGQDVFAQISNGGISWFVGTSILLTFASLIPLSKGISVESKSDGFMTSDAELLNGRFAMMGLIALAFTEYVKGGTLI